MCVSLTLTSTGKNDHILPHWHVAMHYRYTCLSLSLLGQQKRMMDNLLFFTDWVLTWLHFFEEYIVGPSMLPHSKIPSGNFHRTNFWASDMLEFQPQLETYLYSHFSFSTRCAKASALCMELSRTLLSTSRKKFGWKVIDLSLLWVFHSVHRPFYGRRCTPELTLEEEQGCFVSFVGWWSNTLCAHWRMDNFHPNFCVQLLQCFIHMIVLSSRHFFILFYFMGSSLSKK